MTHQLVKAWCAVTESCLDEPRRAEKAGKDLVVAESSGGLGVAKAVGGLVLVEAVGGLVVVKATEGLVVEVALLCGPWWSTV